MYIIASPSTVGGGTRNRPTLQPTLSLVTRSLRRLHLRLRNMAEPSYLRWNSSGGQRVSMIQSNSHFLDDELGKFKECWHLGYFLYHKKCRKLVKGSIILPVPDIVSHSTSTCPFTLPVFLNGWWESDSRLLSSLMMSHNTVSSIGNYIYQTWLTKNSIWISQVQWKHLWCNQNLTNNSNRANCYSN